MASPLQLETPEEKRRRIEQEKLQQQMGNIGFTSVETSAPTQTSVPIETSEPQETSSSFHSWLDSIPDDYSSTTDISEPQKTLEPAEDTSSSFHDWLDSVPDNYIPEDTLLPSDSYYNQDVLDFNYNNKDNVYSSLITTLESEENKKKNPLKKYTLVDLEAGKGPRNSKGESVLTVGKRWLASIGETEDLF